jgi:colanic acid/amylovoran biosynthesis glycosyltransferase
LKKKTLRIIEIVYNWPTETFIQRHVDALSMSNYLVEVIARHNLDAYKENASIGNDNNHLYHETMPNFNHMGIASKLASLRFLTVSSLALKGVNSFSEKTLFGYFKRLHPDLIHFHFASLAATMGWIPRNLGIPYTTSLRGSDIQVLPLQSQMINDAIVKAIKDAAGVHAVCKAIGRCAVQLLNDDLRYSVIYTTLPVPPDLPQRKRTDLDGKINFLSSGRLMWRKGFDNLLLAIHDLRKMGMDARLTIIGVGPDLDQLLYLRDMLGLNNFVNFTGKLNYEQIQQYAMDADAYIQSSIAEGLSNSLAEAMANGLPCFATDVGGTAEVIEDGVSGFLLPALAPQEWVEKLMQVRNRELMESIRIKAYEKAKDLFSADRHSNAFISFFDKANTSN